MKPFIVYAGDSRVAFRLSWSNNGYESSLVSDYEARRPPRGPQRRNAAIHMGISVWATEDAARAKNDEFDGKLGDTVIELALLGELGVWWAHTFSPGHMTIWGRPDELANCIRDSRPV